MSKLIVSSAFNTILDYDQQYSFIKIAEQYTGETQHWKLSKEKKYYRIINETMNQCLSLSSTNELVLSDYKQDDEQQQWNIVDVGEGCLTISNRKKDKSALTTSFTKRVFCAELKNEDSQYWVTINPNTGEKKSSRCTMS
jgi:hypothetical protein